MTANVELYVTMTCPYCHRAIALLDKKGVSYTKTDVSLSPDKRSEMVERANGRRTVPQIFINGEGIGGCDDLYALDAAGKLDAKLEVASA